MQQDDKDYIALKIREDFDNASSRFRGDFYRYEYRLELIERAKRFGLTELVNELKSDLQLT